MKKTSYLLYALSILVLFGCGDKKAATEQETTKKDSVQTPKEEKKPETNSNSNTADLLIGEWELVKETNISNEEHKSKGVLKITKEGFEDTYEGGITKGKWELRKTDAVNTDAVDGLLMYQEGVEMKPENATPYSIIRISQEELVLEMMGQKTYKRKK